MDILINFKTSISGNITISLDDTPIVLSCADREVKLVVNINHGLHYLKFKASDDQIYEIESIIIDGSYLRQTLYLGWGTDGTNRIQPCTHFNNEIEFILPFGFPVSWWLGEVSKQIENGDYGKNLDQLYEIFWPDSIKIDNSFPPLLKDFYYYNHGFTAVSRQIPNYKKKLPYKEIDFYFDTTGLADEIKSSEEIWIKNESYPTSTSLDCKENKSTLSWNLIKVFNAAQGGWLLEDNDLPKIQQLLKTLPVNQLMYAFIGKLEPGMHISPHMDRGFFRDRSKEFAHDLLKFLDGYGLYLPISWDEGNYCKMQNVGILPIKSGKGILMNSLYQHSLINQSTQTRYVIQTNCDLNNTLWEEYSHLAENPTC